MATLRPFRQLLTEMSHFDQLPPTLRQAIANSSFGWCATEIYHAWKRNGLTPEEIRRRMQQIENEKTFK